MIIYNDSDLQFLLMTKNNLFYVAFVLFVEFYFKCVVIGSIEIKQWVGGLLPNISTRLYPWHPQKVFLSEDLGICPEH